MVDELIEAWRANCRINHRLIDAISAAGMKSTLSTHGGRDVARQFGHMHTNRVWQLEKRARDLAEGLVIFEGKRSPTTAQLRRAFAASDAAMETFVGDVLNGKPKRRGFKRGIFTTFAYFVAHESHHRGNILLTLKVSGHGLDKDDQYAIWAWDHI